MSKIKILSIDGGGIRGIIPGTILNYIEQRLKERTKQKETTLADHFDMIAGTSTGGILTCTYLMVDEKGKPKYTAQDALDIYMKRGGDIFSLTFGWKLRTIFGLFGPKYPVKALESALEHYFGDAMTSSLKRPCIITTYDIRDRRTVFFNSVDGINNPVKNYKVKEVTRATSAAPTYFSPALIHSEIDAPLACIDGGTFANNPTLCAYSEARTMNFGEYDCPSDQAYPTAKDMMIVSIGTGTEQSPYYYKNAKNWGAIKWIQPVIDVMMSGNSETVDYQLKQIFDTTDSPEYYTRIQPSLYNANSAMDDASNENLTKLHEAGLHYINDHQDVIEKVIDQVLEDHSP